MVGLAVVRSENYIKMCEDVVNYSKLKSNTGDVVLVGSTHDTGS